MNLSALGLFGVLILTAFAASDTPEPSNEPPAPTTAAPPAAARATEIVSFERPQWVDAAPELRGGAYYAKTFVGPEATRSECERKMPDAVVDAVRTYAVKVLGPDLAEHLTFDYESLRPRVVEGPFWQETIRTREMELVYLHAPLKFDDKLRREWEAAALGELRRARLLHVAYGYGGLMVGLAIVAGLARFRQRRGFTPRAVRLGWSTVALLVVVVVVLLFVLGAGHVDVVQR